MQKNKTVILLPHYNNVEGLIKTLESLKNESDFDLLVIDDGSKDRRSVKEAVEKYMSRYPITTIFQEENAGITDTLNNGLRYILSSENGYDYIARLDAGDVCVNNRIAKQAAFLDRHEDIHLLGSWVDYVDVAGKRLFTLKYPVAHSSIKKNIFAYNTFNHPAVMFRTASVAKVGLYPDAYPALEDHAYFFKFVKRFKTANIPEVLLQYEINPNGISLSNRKKQVSSRLKLLRDNFEFGFYPIYGLLRNLLTFVLPTSFLIRAKSVLLGKANQ